MPTLFDDLLDAEGGQAFNIRCEPSLAEAEALWRTFLLGQTNIHLQTAPPASSSGSSATRISSTSCDGDTSSDYYESEEDGGEWDEDEEGPEGEDCTTSGSTRSSGSERASEAAQSTDAMLRRLHLAHAAPPPAATTAAAAPRRGGRARSEPDLESQPTSGSGPGWVGAADPVAGRRRRRLSTDGAEKAREPAQP